MWRQTPKQSLGGALGSVAHRYRPPRAAGWPPRPQQASQALRWRGTTDEGLPVGSGPTARSLQLARLEAVLFLAREPLSSRRLAQLAGLADGTRARSLAHQLRQFYNQRGSAFQLEEVAGGFQLLTRPKFSGWLLRQEEVPDTIRLSGPAMETLSVVAYRQPVLRADIESIRGVQCGEILRQLMERDLVRIAGRASELGRPFLYGTTRRFLQLFGLRHIEDLPRADQLRPGLHVSDPAEEDESPMAGEGDAVANPPGERHDVRSLKEDRGADEEELDVDSAADTTLASTIAGAEIPGTELPRTGEALISGEPLPEEAPLANGAPGSHGAGAVSDDSLPGGGDADEIDLRAEDEGDEYADDDDAEYEEDDDEYEDVEEGEEEDDEYEYVDVDDDEEDEDEDEEGDEGDDDEYEYEDDDDEEDEEAGDDEEEELEGEWEEVGDDEAEDEEYDYEYDDDEEDDDEFEDDDDEGDEEYEDDDDYEYEDDDADDDADDTAADDADGGVVEWDD